MRKPWVWLVVAATGFVLFTTIGVMGMSPSAASWPTSVRVVLSITWMFSIVAIPVGLIAALICCFLKPKTLDLPYASRARGFEVTHKGGE